eukprot:COSAG01_NODE_229_length_21089_cov_575.019194_6_plen_193_part_00
MCVVGKMHALLPATLHLGIQIHVRLRLRLNLNLNATAQGSMYCTLELMLRHTIQYLKLKGSSLVSARVGLLPCLAPSPGVRVGDSGIVHKENWLRSPHVSDAVRTCDLPRRALCHPLESAPARVCGPVQLAIHRHSWGCRAGSVFFLSAQRPNEAPWLVNGGHSAPLTQRRCVGGRYARARFAGVCMAGPRY